MKDYLLKSDPEHPLPAQRNMAALREKAATTETRPKSNRLRPRTQARTPRWSPHGLTLIAATPAPTPAPTTDFAPYVAEIQRLQAMLTAQAQIPYPDAQFGMPVSSHTATVFSVSRPREFYCWLPG